MEVRAEVRLGRRNAHCHLTFGKKWSNKYFFGTNPRFSGLVQNTVTSDQWLYIACLSGYKIISLGGKRKIIFKKSATLCTRNIVQLYKLS